MKEKRFAKRFKSFRSDVTLDGETTEHVFDPGGANLSKEQKEELTTNGIINNVLSIVPPTVLKVPSNIITDDEKNIRLTNGITKEALTALGPKYEPVTKVFNFVGCVLKPDRIKQLMYLLLEYRNLWDEAEPGSKIVRTDMVEMHIELTTDKPFKEKIRKCTYAEDQIIHGHLQKMHLSDVIRPSRSPYASAVQLVDKKDGKVRFCVDYRRLNKITVKDNYPLPRMQDILDMLGGSKYYSTMDLQTAFWSIPIREEDRYKTAFTTKYGLWEFCSMPFGLTNAPATCQRLAEVVLSGLTWEFCTVYIDDIVVFSPSAESHIKHLELVFEHLLRANMRFNPAKCSFAKLEFEVLGHLCSKDGVAPNPKKIAAITDYPEPQDRDQLHR